MNEKNCGRAYLDASLHDLTWVGVDMRYGAGRQHLICQYLIDSVEEQYPQLFYRRECHGGAQIVQQCLFIGEYRTGSPNYCRPSAFAPSTTFIGQIFVAKCTSSAKVVEGIAGQPLGVGAL